MIHQSTYPNPSPHTHKNTNHQTINKATHTNTNHQQSHTHTNHQTSWSQQRPPHPPSKPLISKPKLPIKNPRCRFETHRSKPIQKKSSPEPPLELPMINPTDPPTNQQIHHFKPTINWSQPTDPNPACWSTMSNKREAVWSFNDGDGWGWMVEGELVEMGEGESGEKFQRWRWVRNFGDGDETSEMREQMEK